MPTISQVGIIKCLVTRYVQNVQSTLADAQLEDTGGEGSEREEDNNYTLDNTLDTQQQRHHDTHDTHNTHDTATVTHRQSDHHHAGSGDQISGVSGVSAFFDDESSERNLRMRDFFYELSDSMSQVSDTSSRPQSGVNESGRRTKEDSSRSVKSVRIHSENEEITTLVERDRDLAHAQNEVPNGSQSERSRRDSFFGGMVPTPPGVGGPGGSILRRSDSFMKRPGSRSVTFGKKSEGENCEADGELTGKDGKDVQSETSEETSGEGRRMPFHLSNSLPNSALHSNRHGSARGKLVRRPSSSGPHFRRMSNIANIVACTEQVKKNFLQRKRSFHLDRRQDSGHIELTNIPMTESFTQWSNLPKAEGFGVRRNDSSVVKALSQSPGQRFEERPKSGDMKEAFEAYVIVNGRLVRRDSASVQQGGRRDSVVSSGTSPGGRPLVRRGSFRGFHNFDEEGRRREDVSESKSETGEFSQFSVKSCGIIPGMAGLAFNLGQISHIWDKSGIFFIDQI